MNPAKSEIKIALSETLGRAIEKSADGMRDRQIRHEGGKDAFAHAALKIGELNAIIDKDLESGVIKDIVGEPLLVVKYAKRYVQRAMGLCDNLATAAEIAVHETRGREKGLRDAATIAMKSWSEEKTKLKAYLEALEASKKNETEIDVRAIDNHPGETLKAKRTAKKPKKAPAKARKTPARKPTLKEASDVTNA